jgi:hypothetical protein
MSDSQVIPAGPGRSVGAARHLVWDKILESARARVHDLVTCAGCGERVMETRARLFRTRERQSKRAEAAIAAVIHPHSRNAGTATLQINTPSPLLHLQ